MTSGAPAEPADMRPRSWLTLLGIICRPGGNAALAISAAGCRLTWWPVTTALNLAEYRAYAATLDIAGVSTAA